MDGSLCQCASCRPCPNRLSEDGPIICNSCFNLGHDSLAQLSQYPDLPYMGWGHVRASGTWPPQVWDREAMPLAVGSGLFELASPSISVSSQPTHLRLQELRGWATHSPANSPVELAGDETLLAPRTPVRPTTHARLSRQLTINCPHHHVSGTACCEKIIYIPEAQTPRQVVSRLPRSPALSKAKGARDFDSILRGVEKLMLKGYEKRAQERITGKRKVERFDNGH
ncbi:hypothetical protein BJ170DRAFT_716538 [Xylariales sp. AK1849]|nr:hypothetical protein BJ170DRAFT_716538 [Xylariales sp. AK1849]